MWFAISGRKGSGKSTVADYIASKYSDAHIFSFADRLKAIASIFGFTDEELYGSKKEDLNAIWNITAREFMQKFGTDICRNILPTILPMRSVWTTLAKHELSSRRDEHVIISDVRFQDELDTLLEVNPDTIVIYITRKAARCNEFSAHSSEGWSPPSPHIHVYNDGTLSDLYACLDRFCEKIVLLEK